VREPAVLYLAIVAEAIPLLAAAAARRGAGGGRSWVLAWCALLTACNVTQLWLGAQHVNNLWVSWVVNPLGGALVLWALSCWLTRELPRLTLRLMIVPFLAVWAVLALAFDRASRFSSAAEPLADLVCLGAAAYTLVARSRTSSSDLLRQDWFWVSAGMVLYFGTLATRSPLSALLVSSDPALLVRAYEVAAALCVVALLSITRGVTCPASS
jgi:hypothetical protein